MPFHHPVVDEEGKDEARPLSCISFSALTFLLGWQERHLAHKKLEALGQCKPLPRHILPMPPSGESV